MTNLRSESRRMYERFPSRFPVRFKDTRSNFGETVQLNNFSAGGAQIFTKEQLYLNDSVALEVELPDGKDPLTIRGEVIWVKKLDADTWDIGLRFYQVVFMDSWRIYKIYESGLAV